jgi:hypothetical protein
MGQRGQGRSMAGVDMMYRMRYVNHESELKNKVRNNESYYNKEVRSGSFSQSLGTCRNG